MDDLIAMQAERIAELEERVRQLEEITFNTIALPVTWRLTATENRMFLVLLKRHIATKQHMMTALYSDRVDDAPHEKIVDVMICKMRKKLSPHGVEIQTIWGQGYSLENRASVCRNLGIGSEVAA